MKRHQCLIMLAAIVFLMFATGCETRTQREADLKKQFMEAVCKDAFEHSVSEYKRCLIDDRLNNVFYIEQGHFVLDEPSAQIQLGVGFHEMLDRYCPEKHESSVRAYHQCKAMKQGWESVYKAAFCKRELELQGDAFIDCMARTDWSAEFPTPSTR